MSFSRGDFPRSKRSVINLVVQIDLKNGDTLGEYELLSLTKLWCPPDDSEQLLLGAARFRCGGAEYSLDALVREYLPAHATGRPPAGGCLQIVFNEGRASETAPLVAAQTRLGSVSARALFESIQALQQEDATAPAANRVAPLMAIACLLQNILDIEHVDLNELGDMLEGVNACDTAVTAIHLGMLFSMSLNDRLFDEKGDTIGISPYLLLPQAVLLHNERLLLDAHALLQQVAHANELLAAAADSAAADALRERLVATLCGKQALDDLPGSPDWLIRKTVRGLWHRHRRARAKARAPRRHVAAFVAEIDQALRDGAEKHAREHIGQWLDRDHLGNIFQYVSERWIVESGSKDRGLDSLLGELRKNLDNLDSRISDAETRHGEWKDSNLAVIGLVITLFQIVPFEGAFRLSGMKSGDDTSWSGLLAWTASGLALMLLFLWRRMLALVYMRALGHVARAHADNWLPTLNGGRGQVS